MKHDTEYLPYLLTHEEAQAVLSTRTSKEYLPYLLDVPEAQAVLAYRAFMAAKAASQRGLTSPSGGTPAGALAIVYPVSPELSQRLNELQATLASIERMQKSMSATQTTMSDTFDAELAALRQDVAAQSTVIASATTFMKGVVSQLAAAEAAAMNAGATAEQISGISSVRAGLEANTASLAAAIPANTSAATDAGAGTSTTAGTDQTPGADQSGTSGQPAT